MRPSEQDVETIKEAFSQIGLLLYLNSNIARGTRSQGGLGSGHLVPSERGDLYWLQIPPIFCHQDW